MSALHDQVIQVLRSGEAGKISFTLGTVKVSGGDFSEVAKEIELGCINIYYDELSEFVAKEDGFYSAKGKTISGKYRRADTFILGFGSLRNQDDKALVIHEAVHAINDLHQVTLKPLDDEMAGYLALALYYRYSGMAAPTVPTATATIVQNIYTAAFALADAVIAGKSAVGRATEESNLAKAITTPTVYSGLATAGSMKYGGIAHIRAGAH